MFGMLWLGNVCRCLRVFSSFSRKVMCGLFLCEVFGSSWLVRLWIWMVLVVVFKNCWMKGWFLVSRMRLLWLVKFLVFLYRLVSRVVYILLEGWWVMVLMRLLMMRVLMVCGLIF